MAGTFISPLIAPHPQHDQQHARDQARSGERDSQLAESHWRVAGNYFLGFIPVMTAAIAAITTMAIIAIRSSDGLPCIVTSAFLPQLSSTLAS
jgi:hypothetical protein